MQGAREFLKEYETKTNSHDFASLEPLIAKDAVYWFTDGSYEGMEQIKKAIINTFHKIKNERYSIKNVQWIIEESDFAVCSYRFEWRGVVKGTEKSGSGRGTNIMIQRDGCWQMLHEHLSS